MSSKTKVNNNVAASAGNGYRPQARKNRAARPAFWLGSLLAASAGLLLELVGVMAQWQITDELHR